MKTTDYFTKENGFYWVPPTVLNLAKTIDIPKDTAFQSKTLGKPMTDAEILTELRPTRLSLGEIAACLKSADKEGWYIFYPEEDSAWAVYAFWYAGIGGWDVGARSVAGPIGWRADSQVFSRNWPSDTQTLLSNEQEKSYSEGYKKGQKDAFGVDRERVKEEGRQEIRVEIERIIGAIEDYKTLNKGNAQNRAYMNSIQSDLRSLLSPGVDRKI